MAKELTARPSKIVMEDGTVKLVSELTPEERDRVKKKMAENVGNTFNSLVQRPDVAEAFLKFHPFYTETQKEWKKLNEQNPDTPNFHDFITAKMKACGMT